MRVNALIHGENATGKVFCFSPSISVTTKQFETKAKVLRDFQQRYETLLSRFQAISNSNSPLDDFSLAYLQVLQDTSFRSRIISYIEAGYSRADSLMLFFEQDILDVLSKRISSEIFGLIRLLSDDTDCPYPIPRNAMLVTPTLTYADILKMDLNQLAGVVLTDSSFNAHDAQIMIKLSIPVALVHPELDLFNKLIFKPANLLTFANTYVNIQPVGNNLQNELIA